MSCRVLIALTLLGAGPGFAEPSTENIDFHDTYEASKGEKELATEQYEQAYGTYSKLAAETSNPGLATVAGARAAVALGLQEGMYGQGLERARAITDRPCSVQAQMQLMVANEDYQKLLDAFADEDIAVWPKRTLPKLWHFGRQDLRALALADRARAYLETGNAEAAVRDAEKALEFADGERHKLKILSFLGSHVYRRTLRDPDKTFETDMRIVELDAGHATTLQARIDAAAYLRAGKRYDEALAVLGSDWKTSQSRHWFTRGMPALAETLAAAGRFGEAADAYRIMAEADDKRTNKAHRSWAALRMAAMLAEAGDSDAAGMVYTDLLARNDVSEDDREQAKAALAELLSGLKGGSDQ